MRIDFYLTKFNSINDAVKIYLNIIQQALGGEANGLKYCTKISEIKKADLLVTYYVKDYFVARIFNRKALMINWFQGILPEESLLWQKSKLRYYIYSFMEWYTLRTSKFNFFVSEAMLKHYQKKYNYDGTNYIIMPCFNADLQNFQDKKTVNEIIEFVYIGSLSVWQCIDKTLEIFKRINSDMPNSRLTILTKDLKGAENLIKQHQVRNVLIDYVPLAKLPNYLLKFNYGFLIREDIKINNVATPNKLNTYMASGVIPIYSNVISAFDQYMESVKYQIVLDSRKDLDKMVNQIVEYDHNTAIDYKEMHDEYFNVFQLYYNEELYIGKIKQNLSNILKTI